MDIRKIREIEEKLNMLLRLKANVSEVLTATDKTALDKKIKDTAKELVNSVGSG